MCTRPQILGGDVELLYKMKIGELVYPIDGHPDSLKVLKQLELPIPHEINLHCRNETTQFK